MAEIAASTEESQRVATGVQRMWLDWNEPLLRQAATWLIDHAERDDGLLRLDRFACITPGRRAGRVLLEETLRQCEARAEHMTPFRMLTPGAMVDALIEDGAQPTGGRATVLESELAWVEALKKQSEQTLGALVSSPPARSDRAGWLALARTINALHRELTGQRKTFAEVGEAVDRLGRETERTRWEALDAIERDYHAILAKLPGGGLIDAEIARERTAATGALPDDLEVVLIGVTELNQVQRTLIARLNERATALIHAPQEHAAGFDPLGCIEPAYWSERVIELDDERIIVADRPSDQAQQVVRELGRLRLPVDHVTIGVEEAVLADQLELAAKWANVHIHRAEGELLERTAPYRLLEVLADWLEEPRFAAFAQLLRHPDMEHWLFQQFRRQQHDEAARSAGDWITMLDEYFAEHLHEKLTGTWLGHERRCERLQTLHRAVMLLLQPLREGGARPIGEWAEPILSVLAEVYAPETEPDERPLHDRAVDACCAIRDGLGELANVHEALQPTVSAHEAIRIALDLLSEEALPMPLRDDQIETLGWLELHADLAPALILMGVNDGVIPRSVTSDPFLPNSLRSKLGLIDNAHRYARDAYRLEAINRSREKLIIITGRRSDDGDPLPPSRLLLACDREHLPRRVRMLSDEHRAQRYFAPLGMKQAAAKSLFEIPQPPSEPPVIERMSVTSFRQYLACPYRFWLERIERLEAFDDTAVELDSLQFGSFVHNVLEHFGNDESNRESADAKAIRAFLNDALDAEAKRAFGTSPMPAVRVQLDRIRRRLDAFAERQAELRREGWRILHCELSLPETVVLDLPGEPPMRISGKIDRIDQHEQTGAYRIIDYKTGNNVKTPIEAHHPNKSSREEWVDLQLPLYRYLAQQIEVNGTVDVGYMVLPRDPDACGVLLADWTDDELGVAIEEARRIVRDVRAGRFGDIADNFGRDDIFANICQTNAFGGDDDDDAAGGNGGEA